MKESLTSYTSWDHPDSNWNQAVSCDTQVDPFCCRTEWQLSYHEAMKPNQKLVVRETKGSVAAFAEGRLAGGKLFKPIESDWHFGCPLIGSHALDLFESIVTEVESELQPNDKKCVFLISGIDPQGALKTELFRRFRDRFSFHDYRSITLCNASFAGGFDGYLSRRSSSQRRSLRKQMRRADHYEIKFERSVPVTLIDAEETYRRMLAVEAVSWKGIQKCGMIQQPSNDYYACMLRRLAMSGSGRVIFSQHEGRDIGFIFGGMAGTVYRGQQFSYSDEWQAHSIGNLLQLQQIQWLCEEGATRYDMGPLMDYKHHWTENKPKIETVTLAKKSKKFRITR
jgi:hypothetical protein